MRAVQPRLDGNWVGGEVFEAALVRSGALDLERIVLRLLDQLLVRGRRELCDVFLELRELCLARLVREVA